jgi:aldehyde dehydrogenase (NAD+)
VENLQQRPGVLPRHTDADDPEAVRIANDSKYGLGGINGYVPEPVAPYGGIKASGIGREFGPEGLASYQPVKSIYQF